jgi:hypothetical protein
MKEIDGGSSTDGGSIVIKEIDGGSIVVKEIDGGSSTAYQV